MTINEKHECRKSIIKHIRSQRKEIYDIERSIAKETAEERGLKVGDVIVLDIRTKERMIITGFEFCDYDDCRVRASRIKKNGESYSQSRAVFVPFHKENVEP